ncbi:MAG TPA: hypothetical protein VJM77_02750 [Nitrospiria bacterium]|nr:hypothetical protein [Nitrospiria bacterium]
MIPSIYETAAYYGAPLSVQPVCHNDLKPFVDLVLKEGESRLRNLLPLILIKQSEGRRDVAQAFDQWSSENPSFQICWEFARLALRQAVEMTWTEEDRDRWRQSCQKVRSIGVEPERALEQIRRFL